MRSKLLFGLLIAVLLTGWLVVEQGYTGAGSRTLSIIDHSAMSGFQKQNRIDFFYACSLTEHGAGNEDDTTYAATDSAARHGIPTRVNAGLFTEGLQLTKLKVAWYNRILSTEDGDDSMSTRLIMQCKTPGVNLKRTAWGGDVAVGDTILLPDWYTWKIISAQDAADTGGYYAQEDADTLQYAVPFYNKVQNLPVCEEIRFILDKTADSDTSTWRLWGTIYR